MFGFLLDSVEISKLFFLNPPIFTHHYQKQFKLPAQQNSKNIVQRMISVDHFVTCRYCMSIVHRSRTDAHLQVCPGLRAHSVSGITMNLVGCTFILNEGMFLPKQRTHVRDGTLQQSLDDRKAADKSQRGHVVLDGSKKRTTYHVIPPPCCANNFSFREDVQRICQLVEDRLGATETASGAASSFLMLKRFLLWSGSTKLEEIVDGLNVGKFLKALSDAKNGELVLSGATKRNAGLSLSIAFEALAESSQSPIRINDAITVAKKCSRKLRKVVAKERAENLTNSAAKAAAFSFERLREILNPHLARIDVLKREHWGKATGIIISALYCYGITARPRALGLLTVSEGFQLSDGMPVIRGELKNRSSQVGTVFLVSAKIACEAIRIFCEDRPLTAPLFANSATSNKAYKKPISLMTKFFGSFGLSVSSTSIRKRLETLAGSAMAEGSISKEDRSLIAQAEDHSLHVAKTVYEARNKIHCEVRALQVFHNLTDLRTDTAGLGLGL